MIVGGGLGFRAAPMIFRIQKSQSFLPLINNPNTFPVLFISALNGPAQILISFESVTQGHPFSHGEGPLAAAQDGRGRRDWNGWVDHCAFVTSGSQESIPGDVVREGMSFDILHAWPPRHIKRIGRCWGQQCTPVRYVLRFRYLRLGD